LHVIFTFTAEIWYSKTLQSANLLW